MATFILLRSSTPSLYDWYFLLHIHPIAVSACALLATSIVSMLAWFLKSPVLCPSFLDWFALFSLVVVAMVWDGFRDYHDLDWYSHHGEVINFGFGLGGISIFFAIVFRKELQEQLLDGVRGYREAANRRTRVFALTLRRLLVVWVPLFLLEVGLVAVEHYNHVNGIDRRLNFWFEYAWPIPISAFSLLLDLWLIFAVVAACTRPEGETSVPVPRKRWMLLAWGFREGVRALLFWVRMHILEWFGELSDNSNWDFPLLVVAMTVGVSQGSDLLVGTVLWGEKPGTYSVAFWTAFLSIQSTAIDCVEIWLTATKDGTLKSD